jgi:hypothetical protein
MAPVGMPGSNRPSRSTAPPGFHKADNYPLISPRRPDTTAIPTVGVPETDLETPRATFWPIIAC